MKTLIVGILILIAVSYVGNLYMKYKEMNK